MFAGGQTYVALSRATCLDGIYLVRDIHDRDIRIDKRIMYYMGRALMQQKQDLIGDAIEQGKDIVFHYVKFSGETTVRQITPHRLEMMEYRGRDFL